MPAILPFSSAIRVGGAIHVSGHGRLPGELKLVSDGLVPEARQALSYMKDALGARIEIDCMAVA